MTLNLVRRMMGGVAIATALVAAMPMAYAQANPTRIRFQLDWRFDGQAAPFLLGRAKGYFASYPRELTNVFTAAALASFDWRNPTNAQAWFETERPWIHPNEKNFLEVDAEAKSLGVIFDSPDFFTKTIAALHDEKNQATAATLLARYAPDGPGAAANATLWEKWWRDNSTYLFYSEMGGYRWYVDSLAKKRGIPSKDLRGSLRADKR